MLNKKRVGIFLVILLLVVFFLFSKSPSLYKTESPQESNASVAIPAPPKAKITPLIRTEKTDSKPSTTIELKESTPPTLTHEIEQARQEAKMLLSSAYTALKSTHAEIGRYSTDFNAIGFDPFVHKEGEIVRYKLGFLQPFEPDALIETDTIHESPESMSTDSMMTYPINITAPKREVASYSDEAKSVSLNDYSKYCKMGCTANTDSFEILLVRPLEGHGKDVWLINDKKEIILVCDGLIGDC